MKDNLDKWIKDAQDEVPDSGEYRRLNRAMLKERMLTVNPRRSRTHRLLVMAASLLILIGFSGQVSQLGSDSFDTTTSTVIVPSARDTFTVHKNAFRGGSVNLPEDYSEADVDEYQRSVAAGEGEIVGAFGTSIGGKTSWMKLTRRTVNGEDIQVGDSVMEPKSEDTDEHYDFNLAHGKALTARTKTEPPHGQVQLSMDGVLMDFNYWTFEYPGYGEVTRYYGTPVQP